MHFEHKDFQKILGLLSKHNVDYMIVSGYAVIFHGYHRTTGDLDIWLKPSNENKAKVINVLRDYQIEDDSIAQVQSKNFEKPVSFQLGTQPWKIEFMTHISGIKFEQAEKEKISHDANGLTIFFIDIIHLKINKMYSGRLKDLADLDELEKIRKLKGDNK